MPSDSAGRFASGSLSPATPATRRAESTATPACAARLALPRAGWTARGDEREKARAGKQRPTHEEHPPARVTPRERKPGERKHPVQQGSTLRVVPQREDRGGECDGQPDPRIEPGGEAGTKGYGNHECRRPEREQRGSESCGHDCEADGSEPSNKGVGRRIGRG